MVRMNETFMTAEVQVNREVTLNTGDLFRSFNLKKQTFESSFPPQLSHLSSLMFRVLVIYRMYI